MNLLESKNRRTVLKTLGAGVAGGTVLSGTATARGNLSGGNLVSRVNSTGGYATFPTPVSLNRRSKNPIDLREDDGDGRWVAEPSRGGTIRCRVENDEGEPPFPNAGFYIDIGPIGEVESITIDAKSVESAGGAAQLTAGILFDLDGDGDYFVWERIKGNSERFVGFGDDAEALVLPLSFPANESFTIDNKTATLPLTDPRNYTFGAYTDGSEIDTDTEAGIQVSVLGAGEGTVEEAIVEEVSVKRS